MNSPTEPRKKRNGKKTLLRTLKWLLIAAAVLFLTNWIVGTVVAGKNQKKIDHFFEQVGAVSLGEYAGSGENGEQFVGNGWYLYLGALSTLSRKTLNTVEEELPEGERLTDEQVQNREAALDGVHALLEEARKAPYVMAVYNYRDPLSIDTPHNLEALSYARLAVDSARFLAGAGNPEKGGERLLDALTMTEGTMKLPTLITAMVRQAAFEAVLKGLTEMIGDLPDPLLERLAKAIGATDLEESFAEGLVGEIFFHLAAWQTLDYGDNLGVADGERSGFEFPSLPVHALTSAFWELDKSVYLDLMLPMALEPSLENARRIKREAIPFYSIVAGLFIPSLEKGYLKHREVVSDQAAMLETLRLEIDRRGRAK
jgi:hypothetical protein